MIMVIGYILTKIVEMLPKFKVLPVSFIKLEHVQDFNFQLGMMIGLTFLYIIIFTSSLVHYLKITVLIQN